MIFVVNQCNHLGKCKLLCALLLYSLHLEHKHVAQHMD